VLARAGIDFDAGGSAADEHLTAAWSVTPGAGRHTPYKENINKNLLLSNYICITIIYPPIPRLTQ